MYPQLTNPELLSIVPDLNGEAGAECEIILPDYCPNILRILQTTAEATVQSCVQSGDRLAVEGKVEYRILYLSEEGNGISVTTQQTVFSCTLDLKQNTDADCTVTVRPRNCTARALNPRKIFVRSSVQITARLSRNECIPVPDSMEGYEVKTCKKTVAALLASAEKPLRISDEFETEGRGVTAILLQKVSFRETEQKPLTDKLIVKADMILDLLCTDEDAEVFTVHKTLPVSQILDLPGLDPAALCRTRYTPLFLNLSVKEAEESAGIIAYDVEINVSCRCYGSVETTWTEDAYSTKTILECTKKPVSAARCLAVNENGPVRETVELGAGTKVLWAEVCPDLRTTAYNAETGRIVCEGIWECRLLVNDAEGSPGALLREIPFLLELPAEAPCDPIRNDTSLLLADLTWAMADADRLELRGTYNWSGALFLRETAETVTEVAETSDRPRSKDTVILYYASAGESAWSVAKEHACPYTELIRANQLEQDVLPEDRMLVILTN